nr:DUF2853 family protein [Allobranchiibius sp. GilTou38]
MIAPAPAQRNRLGTTVRPARIQALHSHQHFHRSYVGAAGTALLSQRRNQVSFNGGIAVATAHESVHAYAPHADKEIIDKMASTYRLVLSNRDASLVSASDPAELKTVRENFLKKKLGLKQSDAELDAAIKDVLAQMKDGKANPRLAVYYLLAEKFDKLDVFKS